MEKIKNKRAFGKFLTVIVLAVTVCVFALTGCTGKSAYELAVENGYTGSLTEWLDSAKGKSAYQLAVDAGFQGTQTEWLASLKVDDVGIEALYEMYQAENPDKTLDDFLATFFSEQRDPVEDAIQRTLRSAVSIRARFGITASISAGSGVIISLDQTTGIAYIMTNYHVIYENAISTNIRVAPFGKEFFGDGGSGSLDLSIKADYIGGSITKDIVVLKTRENEVFKGAEYRVADLADSNGITVGETVIAVGNPEGAGISATRGILNVDSEYIDMDKIDSDTGMNSHRVLRIDAAINGGNSGGGLYNKKGELIGIVNAKAVDEQIDNIGYAIPSNVALGIAGLVMDDVKQNGKFVKFQIGIETGITGSRAVLENGVMRIKEELTVSGVSVGRPASGIVKNGDILLTANLNDLAPIELVRNFTLSDYLYKARAGDKLTLTVLRGGEPVTLDPIVIDARWYADINS